MSEAMIRRRAFTLIELVVVVAIVAVLSSLLLPAVGLVRRAVQVSKCASDQRQVVMALLQYTCDNESYLPLVKHSTALWPGLYWRGYWQYYLSGYLASGDQANDQALVESVFSRSSGRLICPVMKNSPRMKMALSFHMGMNWTLGPSSNGLFWRTLNTYSNQSNILAISEANVRGADGMCLPQLDSGTEATNWHGTGSNIAWLDGHVAFWKDILRIYQAPLNSTWDPANVWTGGRFNPMLP